VTSGELVKFEKFVSEIDRNPRRLKRIVNIYQLITEVAKKRPIAEERPEKVVYDDERWLSFTPKLIKWICLCECYPYRMSLLVLIIEDFEQKGAMNDIIEERLKAQPDIESKLVRWYDRTDENEQSKVTTSLLKGELIATVYFRYVDRFVFAHKLSDKMLRLDSDAEQFAKLLVMPCTDDGSDITVGDILGLIPDTGEGELKARPGMDENSKQRYDSNFSLLSFSFNLNTAMRAQLASERSGHLSESELSFGGTADGVTAAEAVYNKNKRMQRKSAVGRIDEYALRQQEVSLRQRDEKIAYLDTELERQRERASDEAKRERAETAELRLEVERLRSERAK
jgi:hypothetical protein